MSSYYDTALTEARRVFEDETTPLWRRLGQLKYLVGRCEGYSGDALNSEYLAAHEAILVMADRIAARLNEAHTVSEAMGRR